jgi:hypothetical protein
MGEGIEKFQRENKKILLKAEDPSYSFNMLHPSVPVRFTDLGRNLLNCMFRKGAVLSGYCPLE